MMARTGLPQAMQAVAAGVLVMLLMLAPASAASATHPAPNVYRDATEEAHFHALTGTLRCVMCQNESLADSDAPIAHDLRREILAQMRQGRTDAEIRAFLVARYGEFVLYAPRVEPGTWLLWFGPAALLLAGATTMLVVVRRRAIRMRGLPSSLDAPVESSEDW